MSEPTNNPNAINVEDDEQQQQQPVAVAEPVAGGAPVVPAAEPVQAAGVPESEDLDLNAVDFKDEGRIRGLIGELSRKRAENRTLKEQASKAAQLEAQLTEARPLIDFARTNLQTLQQQQQRPPEPPPQRTPAPDPDAEEAARLMDFYKQDGTPDLERGARWLALQDKRSGRVAQQAVQPWAQQNVQERANANYAQLRAWASANNVRTEAIDGLWTAAMREPNGLQTLANPDSVRGLALMAMGATAMSTPKQPAPPAQAPVVTEPSGGRVTTPTQRISGLEERILQQRGTSAAKWGELTKDFRQGATNVLED